MTWVMYDAVDIDEIPHAAHAVAGYVGGKWKTYPELRERFPHSHVLSIAVNAGEDAHCLDVERGDATPAQAPAWVHRQFARGVHLPVIYASLSSWPEIIRELGAHGIRRHQIRAWVAHYTGHHHICRPDICGVAAKPLGQSRPGHQGLVYADGTQWTSSALGRNLDESLLHAWFFPPLHHAR